MRRISKSYLWSILGWIIFGITFLVFNKYFNVISIDDSNLILGIISVGISILSLGLATMKLPKFKGKVECWNNKTQSIIVSNDKRGFEPGEYKWISFRIKNQIEPVKSLVVNFRFPRSIYRERDQDKLKDEVFYIKESAIYTSDKIKFLGVNHGDCEITYEHLIRIHEMGSPNIYLTISGDNIRPTTFKIDKDLGREIDKSDSGNKIYLSKV